jgi:general secretion pathway protein I
MRARFRGRPGRGFTLLEVLVALIFFSLIGLVMQQVTASTVSGYHSVRMKTLASWIAENKMTELRVGKGFPAPREYKEDVSFADLEWELVSQIKTTENPFIHRVELAVFAIDPGSSNKSQAFAMTSFIGRD